MPPYRENSSRATVRRAALAAAGLAILVVAGGLRWPQMSESLWLDELHSAWCVSGTWQEIGPRCAIGNQSPLYFRGLWCVSQAAGTTEWAFRGPSLAAGLALVALVGALAAAWTRSTCAGLLAAALIAVDRNCIFYSQEARPYAVLQLTAWAHAWVVWQVSRQPTGWLRVALILGAVAQFYLHYTAALFLMAELVFLVVSASPAYRHGRLWLDLVIVVAACLPASWHLGEIAARREQWASFVRQPTWWDLARLPRLHVYLALPCLLLAVALLARRSGVLAASRPDGFRLRQSLSLAYVLGLQFVPLLIAWCVTRWDLASLFLARYLVSSLPAAPIASALLIERLPARGVRHAALWRGSAAWVVFAAALGTSGIWQQWRHDGRVIGDRRQDWRGAVAYVNQHADPGRSRALVRSGLIEADRLRDDPDPRLRDYCLLPVTGPYRLAIPAEPLPSNLGEPAERITARVMAAAQRSFAASDTQELWLILAGSAPVRDAFRRALPDNSPGHLETAGETRQFSSARTVSFGDLLVCHLLRQPTSPISIRAP